VGQDHSSPGVESQGQCQARMGVVTQ